MTLTGKLTQWSLIGCLAIAGAGCGKSGGLAELPTFRLEDVSHLAITGSVSAKVEQHLGHMRAEACERTQAAMRRELVAVLDQKAEEIQAVAAETPPASAYNRIKFGPTTVLDRREPVDLEADWAEDSSSWQNAYNYFLKIKSKPMSASWVWLNSNVRSLILNDELRLIHAWNFFLDKDSGQILDVLDQIATSCLSSESCTDAPFDAAQIKFIERVPYYASDWVQVQNAVSGPEKRAKLKGLAERLAADVQRYRIRLNPTITRPRNGVIRLPLVAGPFAGHTKVFSDFVESVWSSPALKLKIKWVEPAQLPGVFSILLSDTLGERPYVLFESKQLQLFPDSRLRSIAHEVGHVLGFRDHYYTVWNPQTCTYTDQSNAADIMSFDGVVTAAEWAALDRAYPFRKKSR